MKDLINQIISLFITGTTFFLCLLLCFFNKYKDQIWENIQFEEKESKNGKKD